MHNQPVVNKITLLLKEIKSNEIMEFLSQPNLDKVQLLTLIVESKIAYDRWSADIECSNIMTEIEEHHIYEETHYNKLITYISNLGNPSQNEEADLKLLLWFRHFHTMLIKTCNVVVKLMTNYNVSSSQPVREHAEITQEIKTEPKIVNIKGNDEDDLNLNAFLKSISLV